MSDFQKFNGLLGQPQGGSPCRFQRQLQHVRDYKLAMKNTLRCRLPNSILQNQVAIEVNNSLNEFHEWLGQALMQNTNLRHLILENMTFTIAPTSATSLAILASGINQSKVESLTIKHNTGIIFTDNSFRTTRTNRRYRGQFLSEILITSTLSPLHKLALIDANLSNTDEMALLAKGLSTNKSLTSLVIESCCVDESGLRILFSPQGLWNSSTLLHLQLIKCNIHDVKVMIMVEHWPLDSPLQTLSLPYNGIGPRGAQLLVLDAAHSHPALQALDLSKNRNIGYDTLRMIGDDLPNQLHLTSLDLSCCVTLSYNTNMRYIFNHLDNEDLVAVACKEAGRALIEGIRRNRCIQHLNVLGNAFSRDVEKEIDFHTSCNRLGGRPLFNDFEVPLSCWSYILAKCQHRPSICPSLLMFCLQEYPNLVPTQSTPL